MLELSKNDRTGVYTDTNGNEFVRVRYRGKSGMRKLSGNRVSWNGSKVRVLPIVEGTGWCDFHIPVTHAHEVYVVRKSNLVLDKHLAMYIRPEIVEWRESSKGSAGGFFLVRKLYGQRLVPILLPCGTVYVDDSWTRAEKAAVIESYKHLESLRTSSALIAHT